MRFTALGAGNNLKNAFDRTSTRLAGFGSPFDGQTPLLEQGDTDGLAKTFCLNGCWGTLSSPVSLEPQIQAGSVGQGRQKPCGSR